MQKTSGSKPLRVAIFLDLDWGYGRHLEVYAGCQKSADELGLHCTINPAADRMLRHDKANPAFME